MIYTAGFGTGAFSLTSPLYVVETCQSSIRGSLSAFVTFMLALGLAFIASLNIYNVVHWNVISGVCMIAPGKYDSLALVQLTNEAATYFQPSRFLSSPSCLRHRSICCQKAKRQKQKSLFSG